MTTSATWTDLAGEELPAKEDLKARLPLEYVVRQHGVDLARQPDGRLVGQCPFHDDQDPSFAVFGDALDRCGCWACDFPVGDVFDFIMRARGVPFPEAVRVAAELLARVEREGFTPSPPPAPRPGDGDLPGRARRAWQLAEGDLTAVRRLATAKGLSAPAEWLHREFHLGVEDQDTVTVPHLAAAAAGGLEVAGLKTRTSWTHLYAAAGSQFRELYGAWRDAGRPAVVLCEGESDTWEMAWRLRDTHDVLGLPSGAAARPRDEWLARLEGRQVTLLLDADAAGRRAALAWHSALAGRALATRVARLEDGADALTAADPVRAVREAVDVPPTTAVVREAGDRYVRATQDEPPVSNWVLRPSRLIELLEGGSAFEGYLPDGRPTLIRDVDLAGEAATVAWANAHGYVWIGTRRDSQGVLDLLLRRRPFLAVGRGTSVAGWHAGSFVLPGLSLGAERWLYVPPASDPRLDTMLAVQEGPWDRAVLPALLALQDPEAVGPILAWVAAAPLRATLPTFPPLAVVGSSGCGKTTLLEQVLLTFGWRVNLTLTGTTPHAVLTYAAATNGVPVWYDEYRPGARRDAREALDQVLRDAWTGQATVKGGLDRANYQRLTTLPASAPILVSGEDALQETSHVERVQTVRLRRDGRRPAALERLLRLERTGLGLAYLTWLVEEHAAGRLPAPALPRSADRPEVGRAVLAWGWQLLRGFAAVTGVDLPDLDLTGVRRQAEAGAALEPILDATSWALDRLGRDQLPLAWVDGEDVLVRVRELVQAVKQDTELILPGGERAVQAWLEERFPGATPERVWAFGTRVRAERLPGGRARVEEVV